MDGAGRRLASIAAVGSLTLLLGIVAVEAQAPTGPSDSHHQATTPTRAPEATAEPPAAAATMPMMDMCRDMMGGWMKHARRMMQDAPAR